MKKRLICTALLGAVVLAGCGSKTDANEKNFSAVLTDELKKIEICLPFEKWPYRVVANDSVRMGQMAVLETAGLVSGADFVADELNFFRKPTGRIIKLKNYSLTEEGKKFFHGNTLAKTDTTIFGHLCYGKLTLDKIIKWESPTTTQAVIVTYSDKLDGLVDWAKKPEFQAVFPGAAKLIGKNLVDLAYLKLTSLGWEPQIASGSGPVLVTPDVSFMNPADNLPVATPAANVVSPAPVASAPPEKAGATPSQHHASAAKHPHKNTAKESSAPQVRQININE